MPLFQSLSFVVNEQIKQNRILLENGISLRSNVSQQLQVVNTNKNNKRYPKYVHLYLSPDTNTTNGTIATK